MTEIPTFLGISDSASLTSDMVNSDMCWNILGLRITYSSFIYPIPFSGISLGLRIPRILIGEKLEFSFHAKENDEHLGSLACQTYRNNDDEIPPDSIGIEGVPSACTIFIQINNREMVIKKTRKIKHILSTQG
jgi:hypothetical protein